MEFFTQISGIHPSDFTTPAFWLALWSIVLIDLVLSGDNAILIAMACRNLPPEQRNKGILWGTAGAIILRIIFGSIIVYLLKIPLVQAIGALLLAWIAVKLLLPQPNHDSLEAPDRLWQAVKTIIIADGVMSLDNVIALAGVSHGKAGLFWFGILISLPLVVYGSKMFLSLMDRFPWILYLGAGILAWTGGEMFARDTVLNNLTGNFFLSPYLLEGKLVGVLFVALVLGLGWYLKRRTLQEANSLGGK